MFNFAGKPATPTTLELMGELRRWNNFDLTKNSPENVYVQKYLSAFLNAIFIESTLIKKLYLYSKSVMLIAVDLPSCNLTM